MLTLRYAQRHSKYSSAAIFTTTTTTVAAATALPPSTTSTSPVLHRLFSLLPSTTNLKSTASFNDIVSTFKAWILARKIPFFERIFNIMKTQEGISLDYAMANLHLKLNEVLVLEILNFNMNSPDLLSCLKFFDWAGRQEGFCHTEATYRAIVSILYRGNCIPLMLEFSECFPKERSDQELRFYSTLVIGYSVAGKPEIALQIYHRMRSQGIDLVGSFEYNLLLNALVEGGDDEGVGMIVEQIRRRGMEDMITCSIVMKNFCMKREFDKAEEYLLSLSKGGLSGVAMVVFVDALCKDKQYRRAIMLVKDLNKSYNVGMGLVHRKWVRYLIKARNEGGELELEFLKDKRLTENYCNSLVNELLQENRLEEVFDLLMEMKEQHILPDERTMNSVFSFFCKAGMVDFAVQLYDSIVEFGMSVSSTTYNNLINALVGKVRDDKAYRLLETAIDQGYTPDEKIISIVTYSLSRDRKHEKMKKLLLVSLENSYKFKDSTYSKFISTLCRAKRVEDGYTVHGYLNRSNKVPSRTSYHNLIKGYNQSNRGDIAARLLIEMQEEGHVANRLLFRAVIFSLCVMKNSEVQVLRFLQMQLNRHEPSTLIFNHFIDGTWHAEKPEISRKVYEIMRRVGISLNFETHVLMLKSYLNNGKITDALNFFHDLPKSHTSARLSSGMIIGLCKVERLDYALKLYWKMGANKMTRSELCYEALVKLIAKKRKYGLLFGVIDDMIRQRSRIPTCVYKISTFVGNVLLLHCLKSRNLFNAWVRSRNTENQTPSDLMLGKLIGSFSGCIDVSQDVEDMEELLKQCYKPDLFTYNMFLRRLIKTQIDHACEYVNRMREKGYEPNEWTYNALVHACYKHGRDSEARKWRDVMFQKGFALCKGSKF